MGAAGSLWFFSDGYGNVTDTEKIKLPRRAHEERAITKNKSCGGWERTPHINKFNPKKVTDTDRTPKEEKNKPIIIHKMKVRG